MLDLEKMARDYGNKFAVANYKLSDREVLGQDGQTILCRTCGEVLRRKTYSAMARCFYWDQNRKDDGSLCACDRKVREAQAKQRRLEDRLKIYDSKAIRALMGEFYLKHTFDNIPANDRPDYQHALNACKRYSDNVEEVARKGQGLYIWSPTAGNGKTTLMACMRNAIVAKGMRAVMINCAELMRQAMDRGRPTPEGQLYSYSLFLDADVLLLDDIGVQDLSLQNNYNNWVQTELYELLDYRNRNNLSTVFTSNYSPEDLQNKRGVDFKTVDRIIERSTLVVKIEGTSFRGRR